MRIAAAARAGGDLPAALGLYRRAAALAPGDPAPLAAAGDVAVQMGKPEDAIVAYNAALARAPHDPAALRGLARAYLMTGKPALALRPLAIAERDTPNDPKLLQLAGVVDDFSGDHEAAQARYRRGLQLLPNDPGLSIDLALSLALTGNYEAALAVLAPLATAANSTTRERQTLALVYGLKGDRASAERLARRDLDPATVARNLAYYDTLRALSPEARSRALQSLRPHGGPPGAT
jgi:Flp pilus assembly protein TadD